ncbi:unnamed protein product [Adineta steineri]|uniref:G-protein coupled receptors family 1 profile domain-containing protein n=1 Tax=Adineta steineri TaxID=433720 RepID=A0A815KB52_9BILA|nr:unnamed protein product [Adineta steineri]
MASDMLNNTKNTDMFSTGAITWCLLVPLIHVFSLMSNILCIIVFCSNIFIKKPIAIYFISLLLSDSMTLFIGYVEMTDRETSMINKSSSLCAFNNIFHRLYETLYTFMGTYCLEWMLYKLLWTRASIILLAILSVQRTRTFFSLSYRESRVCALFACIFSIIIAAIITCIEWTDIHYENDSSVNIHSDIFHVVIQKDSLKQVYSTYLYQDYNDTINNYPCMIQPFNVTFSSNMTNQFNCSSNITINQFQLCTKSLLDHGRIIKTAIDALSNITFTNLYSPSHTLFINQIQKDTASDFISKLFSEPRSCQIKINYLTWLRTFDFFNSVSFKINRHIIAIFFGNALPSFIVVLANLLSIKVIYFSKSLKYLKQTTRKSRRKRRLQNDLRAFLVILIESFLNIMISWGVPVLLTMYHCRVLYVDLIETCLEIKGYLVLFLLIDLLKSATNCLLYSLSGKLYRRRLIRILKMIFKGGHGTLWNVKQSSSPLSHQPLDRQLSNNPSTVTNNNNNNTFGIQSSRPGSCRRAERLSSPLITYQNKKMNNSIETATINPYIRMNGQNHSTSADDFYSVCRASEDFQGGDNSLSGTDSDSIKKANKIEPRKSSQSIGSFLLGKVRSLSSANSSNGKTISFNRTASSRLTLEKRKIKSKNKFFNSLISKRTQATDVSFSSSSITGSIGLNQQSKHSANNCYSSPKVLPTNIIDNSSIIKENIYESLTSL